VRLRECLVSFVGEATDQAMVPDRATPLRRLTSKTGPSCG
jgi:hypothetical protein